MYTEKEFSWILLAIILMMFIIEFPLVNSTPISIIISLIVSILIILTATLTKKISSKYYNIKIEHKLWTIKQYGFRRKHHTKNPFPIGLIFPFLISFLSLGLIKMFTLIQFDAENVPTRRILKESGRWKQKRTEINESDLAFTAAWGFLSLILLAIIGSLINFPQLTKYSVYYGFWNLLPLIQLDGSKLFFGSPLTWVILFLIYAMGLIIVIF